MSSVEIFMVVASMLGGLALFLFGIKNLFADKRALLEQNP